jgi:hypothetical protein
VLGVGLIEGFFGPEWSWEARSRFCENLPRYGGQYYFYAPKRDPFLRKNWQQPHPPQVWKQLLTLREHCRKNSIGFGVGLSPFEIHSHWGPEARQTLRDKIERLGDLHLDYLGLFFDDMKGIEGLAEIQCEITAYIESLTKTQLIFCPTYYSDDPILDKVFGARPERYLEKIGSGMSTAIHILWTGSKVISPAILAEELEVVAKILKRKPVLWDNYFANDGPRQCKFLRVKPLEGRDPLALRASGGWAFNLMNQPGLSEICFQASVSVVKNGEAPGPALHKAIQLLTPPKTGELIERYRHDFSQLGLDGMQPELKQALLAELGGDRYAKEIADWLSEKYLVGPECLTD